MNIIGNTCGFRMNLHTAAFHISMILNFHISDVIFLDCVYLKYMSGFIYLRVTPNRRCKNVPRDSYASGCMFEIVDASGYVVSVKLS